MTTTASAQAPYINTQHLYSSDPLALVTSLVEDDSTDVEFIDITAKLQIVNGEHSVVLDFSCFRDGDTGTLVEELLAVDRLLEEVRQFRRQFYQAVNNATRADA